MKMRVGEVSIAIAMTVCVAEACAQSAPFLAGPFAEPRLGESIELRLERDGDRVPFVQAQVDRLFIRAGGGQRNIQGEDLAVAPDGSYVIQASDPDVIMVGVDMASRIVTMRPADLQALSKRLAPKGQRLLDAASTEPRRILRRESGKSLVRVRGPGDLAPSGLAQSKSGQVAEIRLYADPTRMDLGSDMPVRTYAGPGRPQVVIHVQIGNVRRQITTNDSGQGHLTIDRFGHWRLEFHHLEPAAPDSGADFVLYTGTLSFDVPEPE